MERLWVISSLDTPENKPQKLSKTTLREMEVSSELKTAVFNSHVTSISPKVVFQ